MIKHSNGCLEEYHQKCKSKEIIIGLELMMLLDKLIQDLDNDRYVYDTTKADEYLNFMCGALRLTKSPYHGKKPILMLWQRAFISTMYGFKMAESGFDRFKEVILLIGRKNCKSSTTAMLAITEFILGPSGAEMVVSSNDDAQAGIIYNEVDKMRIFIDPKGQDTHKNQQWILNRATDTKIFKLSDRTRNKEGRNVDWACLDESHELRDNTIAMSIRQSMSLKENPKFINITTEGFTNLGYLDEELIRARKILNGEDDSISAERMLPWLYTNDSEQEIWQDERSWMKSNPTLGTVKKWDYLREKVDEARTSKATRMFVLAKEFNQKVSNSEAWLMPEDYNYDATFDLNDFKGSLCLGGVDLAQTTDLACAKVLLMRPNDRTKYIHTMYFIPESKLTESSDTESGAKYAQWARDGLITITPGNDVDLALVADWFGELVTKYSIRPYKIGYDQRFSRDFLRRAEDWGFDCELINQNAQTLSNAAKLVEADLKDQALNYNNNPIDAWCFGNSSIKIDNFGNILIVKIDNQANRRIDGAVTTVIAYEVFRRYRSEFMQNLQ